MLVCCDPGMNFMLIVLRVKTKPFLEGNGFVINVGCCMNLPYPGTGRGHGFVGLWTPGSTRVYRAIAPTELSAAEHTVYLPGFRSYGA